MPRTSAQLSFTLVSVSFIRICLPFLSILDYKIRLSVAFEFDCLKESHSSCNGLDLYIHVNESEEMSTENANPNMFPVAKLAEKVGIFLQQLLAIIIDFSCVEPMNSTRSEHLPERFHGSHVL